MFNTLTGRLWNENLCSNVAELHAMCRWILQCSYIANYHTFYLPTAVPLVAMTVTLNITALMLELLVVVSVNITDP